MMIAKSSPLGFNSYDGFTHFFSEKAAIEQMEVMAKIFAPHGYEYFVIDYGWYTECELEPGSRFPVKELSFSLDENGLYLPCKTYFPNGIEPLVKRAKSLGLKFGLHLMRGIPKQAVEDNVTIKGTNYTAKDIVDYDNDCAWNDRFYGVDMLKPGAQEWYDSVIQKMVEWDIEFIKVDDLVPYPKEIEAVKKALANCGKEMILSLSPGDKIELSMLPWYRAGQMLRVTCDVWDDESSIDRIFVSAKKFQGLSYPGFWLDFDMIPFGWLKVENPLPPENEIDNLTVNGGGFKHICQFSEAQKRTFITILSLMSSPLMLGGEISTMPKSDIDLLTNPKMLECDQKGSMASLVSSDDKIEIWACRDIDNLDRGWAGVFNRGDKEKTIELSLEELGIFSFGPSPEPLKCSYVSLNPESPKLYDVWNKREIKLKDSKIELVLSANDVCFIEFGII